MSMRKLCDNCGVEHYESADREDEENPVAECPECGHTRRINDYYNEDCSFGEVIRVGEKPR